MSRYAKVVEFLQQHSPPGHFISGLSPTETEWWVSNSEMAFPDAWLDWLQEVNGAFLGGQYLTGICQDDRLDIRKIWARYPVWKRKNYIPVGGDGLGNFYVICTQQEYGEGFPIAFMDREIGWEEPAFLVSSGFEVFVELVVHKEINRHFLWPFDEITVRRHDPELLRFRGLAFPWQEDRL